MSKHTVSFGLYGLGINKHRMLFALEVRRASYGVGTQEYIAIKCCPIHSKTRHGVGIGWHQQLFIREAKSSASVTDVGCKHSCLLKVLVVLHI